VPKPKDAKQQACAPSSLILACYFTPVRQVLAYMKIPSLFQARSGFLTLEFEAYDSLEWLSAVNMLENDLGLIVKVKL